MRTARSAAMVALVFLFLAEAQRAFFPSIGMLIVNALTPAPRPGRVVLSALPLLFLLVPLLPVARWLDRSGAVAVGAAGVAIFRLPMSQPALATRLGGSVAVLAFAGMFLAWSVGWIERRALVAGAVAGLVGDGLLRVAGASYDLSLQPAWVPAQIALSVALLALAWALARADAVRPARGEGLERRAGGLRRRGALALGLLLFLDLHVLGAPSVTAAWSGAPYGLAALATAGGGGVALGFAGGKVWPARSRRSALLLVLVLAGGLLAARAGVPGALAMGAAHATALLLVARTLEPANGRRPGAAVAGGLLVFVVSVGIYALTFHDAPGGFDLHGQAPWVLAVGLASLGALLLLLPHAPGAPPGVHPRRGWVPGLAVPAMAAVLLWAWPGAALPPTGATSDATTGARSAPASLRVASYQTGDAYDARGRFEPGAIAAALRRADADVVALHAVPIGSPTAYGADLPRWLAREAGLRWVAFADVANGLVGEAVLSRLPATERESRALDGAGGGRLVRVDVRTAAGDVPVYATRLSDSAGSANRQAARVLASVAPGWAVVLGAGGGGAEGAARAFRGAGFREAAAIGDEVEGRSGTGQSPLRRPDWILTRGPDAGAGAAVPVVGFDNDLPVAALPLPPLTSP